MRLALRLAWRELRSGVRGLGVVMLCLTLGVAAIAAVGELRSSVSGGLAQDGRALLGGDVEVQTGAEVPPPALLGWLRQHGDSVSMVTRLRTLLVASSGKRALVELRAVDPTWPLVGVPTLDPPIPLQAALAPRDGRYGVLVDPLVLDRLGLKPGAVIRMGTAQFTVTAALLAQPDRLATPALFGAPVVIAAAALPETSLVVPGSIVSYAVRATRVSPADVTAAFPDRGWRVRGPAEATPGVARFVTQTALFMSLVGLTALLVGGIGVASGIRAWLQARERGLAILRCLGASSRLVFAITAIQVAVLASCGILAGLALGILAARLLVGWLPVPAVSGIAWLPLLIAAVYGVLTAACFGIPPLARAMRIKGAVLFREGSGSGGARPSAVIIGTSAGLGLALAGLAIATAPDRGFAIGFCVTAVLALLLFTAAGGALARTAPVLRLPGAAARLGIGGLRRPGAPTRLMLLAVGIGLSTLAAVALIEGNISHALREELPRDAPSFYFIDIQPDELARFDAIVQATAGATGLQQVPSLRARIVAVNGVPASEVRAAPDTRWALQGDLGLTYAATQPPGTQLAGGAWWPANYAGPPLVSLDAHIAEGWGIGLGAVIRVNVLGRDLDLKVASLRDIAWRRLGLNFVLVASPGVLSGAPHTNIAIVRVPRAEEGRLLARVADALPNVTGISVTEVIAAIEDLAKQIGATLGAMGGVTLAAGCLVLAGAIAAGRRRRIREAVILKALGATRAQLRTAWLVEFGVIGIVAGILSAGVGTAASWAVMRFVLERGWVFLPDRLAATIAGALALMLVFGYAVTAAALRVSPAAWLRGDSHA